MVATYNHLIEEIANTVFATMLNLELMRIDEPAPPDHDMLLATVHIAGEWTGSVVLALSPEMARVSASAMLMMPEAEVTSSDEQEVASEISNMIGGNLKSLLPGPSFLSLPTIVSGREFGHQVRDAELIDDIMLANHAGLLRVRLYAKQTSENPGR
jgi:chemotaxis protein CheX